MSVYILRRNSDPVPGREKCSPGDLVIMASGDVLAWSGAMWLLLPGRYLSVDELKEFVSYVATGWPDDSETFTADMAGVISHEDFVRRAAEACGKIEKVPEQKNSS